MACPGVVTLPREMADQLRREIEAMLNAYDYWPDGSDWTCRFCSRRPRRNGEDIPHADNCSGLEYLTALERALD
jgi:hypothetical protein